MCDQNHTCWAPDPGLPRPPLPQPCPSAATHILEGVHGDDDLIGQRRAVLVLIGYKKGDLAGEGGTDPREESRTAK